jgi:hypothetical protein
MNENLGEEDVIMVEPIPLLSTTAAAKLAGVGRRLWPAIAEANGLTAVPTGRRVRWRKTEVVKLVTGGRDTT